MLTDTILGISLGTRRVGMAIGTEQELIDWQIKVFNETYSKKKAKKIWRTIERTIEKHNIQAIGLKFCQKVLRTDGLAHCLEFITDKAISKGIIIYFYDIQTIERYFLKTQPKNKFELATAISNKYPELRREYFKLSKSQYQMKVFEAVGAMDLALSEFL